MTNTAYEMRGKIAKELQAGITNETVAKIKKQLSELTSEALDDLEWRIKDDLAQNLAWHVHEMFRRAFEAMLDGNEDMFRGYLHANPNGYTGRDGRHNVIHGELFEYGCIVWRRKLVDAFPDLLKDERVLDLEDQVRSLVEKVNKLETRNHKLIEDLNNH